MPQARRLFLGALHLSGLSHSPSCVGRVYPELMTNTLAVILGVLLISVFAVDQIYYDGTLLVLIMEQLVRLSQYLAFWR